METGKPASASRSALGDFAPKLVELTDEVLFGDVWERPQPAPSRTASPGRSWWR